MPDLLEMRIGSKHRAVVGREDETVTLRVDLLIPGPTELWREAVQLEMSRQRAKVLSVALNAVTLED